MKGYYSGLQVASGIGTLGYNYYNSVYGNRTTGQQVKPRYRLRTGGSQTVTIRKRKNEDAMIGAAQFTRSKRKYGRYKRKNVSTLNRRIHQDEEKLIVRWQNVSRFGISGGKQGIYSFADANYTCYPLHIFDLTQLPGNPKQGYDLGDHRMYNVGFKNADGEIGYFELSRQDQNGDTAIPASGFVERGVTPSNVDHANLKWVDLKMNLYGSYGRPVKFKVALIQWHDEVANPGAGKTNLRLKQSYEELLRPYRYSNLLTNTGELKKSYRIIKQWNYCVEPLNKTEQWNVNTEIGDENASPHFVELKAFLKMDRDCNYAWHDDLTTSEIVTDKPITNQFQVTAGAVHDTVYPTKRVFLCIMASSPDVSATPMNTSTQPDATIVRYYGSYDIVLRRCFYYPK